MPNLSPHKIRQGRYTPTVNGKRIARNIYAVSEEECEVKLEALIKEMKEEFGIKQGQGLVHSK